MMSAGGVAVSTCFVEAGGISRMSTEALRNGRGGGGGGAQSRPQIRQRLAETSSISSENMMNHMSETTKAAAWAVFQHHGGAAAAAAATNNYDRCYGNIAVRRATRFKIEAQMKKNVSPGAGHAAAVQSTTPPQVMCATTSTSALNGNQWDAGSTLFDSYELDSLSKQFDRAFLLPPPSEPSSSSSCNMSSLEQQQQQLNELHYIPGGGRATVCYIDELDSHEDPKNIITIDTRRMTSPFSPQQSHQDARLVLPITDQYCNDLDDNSALEYCTTLDELATEEAHDAVHEKSTTTTHASSSLSSAFEEPAAAAESHELKIDGEEFLHAHCSFQFAAQHTPNPLNLSQRKSRRGSMDKLLSSSAQVDYSSARDAGAARRQSFQEKLRSFFHKARISPQESSSSSSPPTSHNRSAGSRGRKSYTGGPQDAAALSTAHYGWSSSYVVDADHTSTHSTGSYCTSSEESRDHELLLETTTTTTTKTTTTTHHQQHKFLAGFLWKTVRGVAASLEKKDTVAAASSGCDYNHEKLQLSGKHSTRPYSKSTLAGSFSFRSVAKALQYSLTHFQAAAASVESHRQQQQQQRLQQGSSTSTTDTSSTATLHHHEHQHHHVVYHHHHHHVVISDGHHDQALQQAAAAAGAPALQVEEADYELTLQDIDRRVPRKSIEEKTCRISFEEYNGNGNNQNNNNNNNNFKVPRNSLEEKRQDLHDNTISSEGKTNNSAAACNSTSTVAC